jgi:major membrane immunogen (membrane-anchored lipoprotein)
LDVKEGVLKKMDASTAKLLEDMAATITVPTFKQLINTVKILRDNVERMKILTTVKVAGGEA